MNDLFSVLAKQVGGDFVKQVSAKVGADESKTKSMIDLALPLITKSLAKNAASEKGAESLGKALDKKHDGSVLNSLGSLISNPEAGEGAGILKHLLGAKTANAEKVMAEKAGVKPEQSSQILKILAPMVLGQLGKAKKSGGLDLSQIVGMISGANKKMEDPNNSMMMTLATKFLDKDGDGDIKDDLLGMGMKAVSGFFKGKA